MMKSLFLTISIFLTSQPSIAQPVYRSTLCNVYYNNRGRVFEGVDCKAWFSNQRLARVNVYLPHAKRWYDWSVNHSTVTPDPRWNECLRYTYASSGNQYQVCTQKNPQQLGV